MRRHLFTGLIAVSALGFATACAEAPIDDVERVKAELEELAEDGTTYAAESYAAATEHLAQLEQELVDQEQNLTMFRSYDRAEELMALTRDATEDVRQAIIDERLRLQTETSRVIGDAEKVVADAQRLSATLPGRLRGKGQGESWASDLKDARASLDQAQRLLNDGQIAEAHRVADEALITATDVLTSVSALRLDREAAQRG